MRREQKIYHLCNLSQKVIFRNEEDYLVAIGRLAACAYETSTEVWAYSFMSTHFHLVVKSENIARFATLFKINIARWHNKKYINNIQINIKSRELLNEGAIKIAVNYVLKNPIHHKIVEIAFNYPYSSAHIYYKKQIYPAEYYEGERIVKHIKKPSDLSEKIYRLFFASHKVPDNYLIVDYRFLFPDSFIKVSIIEKLYHNVREFMYNMNKPLQEELEMFDAKFGETRVSLFGKLTDIEVCKIIDGIIYPKTYTQITHEERLYLSKHLAQKGVDKFQFERVV